jgi:hypothetical protein
VPAIPNANEHYAADFLVPEKTQPGRTCHDGSPAGHVRSAFEASYGFGAAEAALLAASAAALEAAAASAAAAEAEESAEATAGGVVSAAGAGGASVLLPHALNTNAATKALRAILVFIYRYPRKI